MAESHARKRIGTRTIPWDDRTRERISTSMIRNRLESFIEGKLELSPHQVTAALGLLKKVIPDLSSKELTIKKPLEGLSEHELIDLLDTIRQLKAGRVGNDGAIATPTDTRH